jgi:hypothetical protein
VVVVLVESVVVLLFDIGFLEIVVCTDSNTGFERLLLDRHFGRHLGDTVVEFVVDRSVVDRSVVGMSEVDRFVVGMSVVDRFVVGMFVVDVSVDFVDRSIGFAIELVWPSCRMDLADMDFVFVLDM